MSDLTMLLIGAVIVVGVVVYLAVTRPNLLGAFFATPIGSAVRVFIGLVLGYLVVDFADDKRIDVTLDEISTWVAAALVIVVPLVIAAVNPNDPRWGKTG